MTGLLEAFIAHKDDLATRPLPAAVVEAVTTFTIDSLGVGIAGAAAPLPAKVRAAALRWGEAGSAPLFGPGAFRASPTAAAFINGFQIHCQEYDCVHEPAVVHPMASILAALSADCAGCGAPVSGDRFVRATALAVDVAATLGVAARSPIRFFRPANAGLFGATMGIAFLRRLTNDQALDAMGYALSFNAGTMQAHVEGKPALPVQIGHAARSALMACDLAEAGVPGSRDSLEGPFGYFRLFETETDVSGLAEALGHVFRITEVSHKPFPTGRAAQCGIVLMQMLRERGIGLSEIEAIELSAPPLIERLVGRPLINDMPANYARLCFAYVGAAAFLRGTVGLDDFTAVRLADAEVRSLGARISVTTNHVEDPAAFVPQTLTARLVTGGTVSLTTERLYGSPALPMTREAQREKFAACVAFAHGSPVVDLGERLWDLTERLDLVQDVRELFNLASTGERR